MNIIELFRVYVSKTYSWLTSLCSISGFVALFVKNETACIISLCFFCICLLIILYSIFRAINKLTFEHSDEEYRGISSFYTFECTDGKISYFEVYRLIQCKRTFLTSINYDFKWTGTKKPELTSNTQLIKDIKYNNDKSEWDKATIMFNHPLKYNESTVVHVKTKNDDYDNQAKPYLSCKLRYPIEMMVYRILLPYKPDDYNKNAIFERKKIDRQIDGDFEYIESIPFNKGNKQYFHCAINPEPGYIYRLRWEK